MSDNEILIDEIRRATSDLAAAAMHAAAIHADESKASYGDHSVREAYRNAVNDLEILYLQLRAPLDGDAPAVTDQAKDTPAESPDEPAAIVEANLRPAVDTRLTPARVTGIPGW